MRSHKEIISHLLNPGLVAVLRVSKPEQVLPVARALLAGGFRAIEVTMTTPNALACIREAKSELGPDALVGVGTVLDSATCQAALDAGAEFVVSPITRLDLVAVAHRAGKPIMIGAYTPTEAQLAHEAGADFIKIFPADTLGPAYIKALRGPLPHLRIVPTGGVDLGTLEAFFKAGCAAVGVGSSLLKPDLVNQARWADLTSLARQFVLATQKAKAAFVS